VKALAFARAVLLAVALLVGVALPAWIVIVNSIKPSGEAQHVSVALPSRVSFDAFAMVLNEGKLLLGYANSFAILVATLLLLLTFGSVTAWVLARTRRRIGRLAYYLAVAGIAVPPAVVTSVWVLRSIGLYGDRPGIVLFYTATFLSLTIFLIAGFVRSIPIELEEAARIDGCSWFDVFARVVAPLLVPVLTTATIVLSVFIWNEFFYAFFLLNGSERATVPLGLYTVASQGLFQLRWNVIFAHVILASIPMVVLFTLGQRRIMSGLLSGAIKG
jgi:raffinose/stachyose/melibiose transport system permease protein